MGGRGAWSHVAPRLKNYKSAIIRRSRVSNYLLNSSKSKGKAAYLKSLGYNMRNQARLQKDIRDGLKTGRARVSKPNKHGRIHFQVNMTIGVNKKGKVVTGWFMNSGDSAPTLSTVRPHHGKRDDF